MRINREHTHYSLLVYLCLLCLVVVGVCVSPASAKDGRRVVFLNPGAKDDAFFKLMTDFMRAAAVDLGFELSVLYASRNHVLMHENISTIFSAEGLPDYVIGMNSRGTGERLLAQAKEKGVKVVIINQGFTSAEQLAVGKPRGSYDNWLFEYLPDDVQSGYLLARTLITERLQQRSSGSKGRLQIVALTGHEKSPASRLRAKGLRQAVAEFPDVGLHQIVHADWKRETAMQQAMLLIGRYPDTSVVWAASDVMADGAADGVRRGGKVPGRDVSLGGVDWASVGLDNVTSGVCSATVGGHFMDGGWALVMLYDFLNGVDVPASSRSEFSVLTKDNVAVYRAHFMQKGWSDVDFSKFSKHLNPDIKEYDFSVNALLEQVR